MIEVIAAIGGVKTAFETIKVVRDLLKGPKPDVGAALENIDEIHDKLYEAREALVSAKDRIHELEEQLKNKNDLEKLEEDTEFQKGGYLERRSNKAREVHEPLCPTCWRRDSKMIPLTPGATPGTLSCPIHHSCYHSPEYKQERSQSRGRYGSGSSDTS